MQRVADRAGVDLLHVKGPATAEFLRANRHRSSDVDVLVRPGHVERLLAALQENGWALFTDFEEGSPFGHAANLRHATWSFVDVHRHLPGPLVDAETVFDRLWRDREAALIAHRPCAVPSLPGQVLVQVTHAARSHASERAEAWDHCDDDLRRKVRALADELAAGTALAAGIGELARHRDAPDFALWRFWSSPDGDRVDEWMARIRSASGVRAKLAVLRRALPVNRTHLALRLGREPRHGEVLREQFARIQLALAQLGRRWGGRR
ncbi:nucleotidyltransferase family protein [Microbacterium sp. NPDC056052]|uniref:nucleotidyltransferase family protein n=1 Tax=Microbacterium sp. NPDC056052 TaxID=3345695 RepID=UPI0035DEF11B